MHKVLVHIDTIVTIDKLKRKSDKMRSLIIAVAIALALCTLRVRAVDEDSVLVITTDNFQQIIDENEHVLVEFYAPWCGACQALAPEYAKAAGQLSDDGSAIKLGKVDATVETDLAQEHGVRLYPTLKFYKNGKEMEYGGGHTAKEIVAWLTKRTGPPIYTLETAEDAKAFSEKDDVVVIGFFEDAESEDAKAYMAAADSQDTIYFGIVTSAEVAEAMEAKLNTIVLFKTFDEGRVTYDGQFTAEEIVKFVLGEQLPLVTKFTDETALKIFGGQMKTHMLAFFPGDDEAAAEETLQGMREVAADFKGEVLFVHIDTADNDSSRVVDFFNVEDGDTPTCRIINLVGAMTKFVPEFEGLAAEDIRKFVQSYINGDLKAHLNTEDVSDDWNANPVKVLVGKNFNEVAMDETKHVFVEFYAPWCGHCKQLAPIWDELAEHFAGDEDVVIAKMDATKNEVEGMQVEGFPTLKWIAKDTNEILNYEGGRTLDDLIQYVEKQVSGGGDDDDDTDTDDDSDTESNVFEEVPKDEL